jgi:IS30 family transposase
MSALIDLTALQPKVSNRAIAKALGVDHKTINNDARGEKSPSDGRKAKKNRKGGGEKSPRDGACDARRIVQRDTFARAEASS